MSNAVAETFGSYTTVSSRSTVAARTYMFVRTENTETPTVAGFGSGQVDESIFESQVAPLVLESFVLAFRTALGATIGMPVPDVTAEKAYDLFRIISANLKRNTGKKDTMLVQFAKEEMRWLETLEEEIAPTMVAKEACIKFFAAIPDNIPLPYILPEPSFDCVGDGGIQCEWRKDRKGVLLSITPDGRVFLHQFVINNGAISQHDFKFPSTEKSVEVLTWFNNSES